MLVDWLFLDWSRNWSSIPLSSLKVDKFWTFPPLFLRQKCSSHFKKNLLSKIINFLMHSWPRVLLWTSNNGGSLEMTLSVPFMRKIVSVSVKTFFYLKNTLDFDGPPAGLESLSPLSNIGLRYFLFLINLFLTHLTLLFITFLFSFWTLLPSLF